MSVGYWGSRSCLLYTPPGVQREERLPLLVMLHGCTQDAAALAASTHMNQVAARERFLVLYPQQGRLANVHGCWNWYDTRSGRAQREADSIDAAIDRVCAAQPVDPARIALAGLSAGASMAALLATRRPGRFAAVAMHSGMGPGAANSSASALAAMRGHPASQPLRELAALPKLPKLPKLPALAAGLRLPALLVIHGSADHLVASSNGLRAALLWASHESAKPDAQRTVQRGARYPCTVTDYRTPARLVATHCVVRGLGHAWSGGSAGHAYSDARGPDAARMVWAFAAKQFAPHRLFYAL